MQSEFKVKNQLNRPNKLLHILILGISTLLSINFVNPASAIVPEVRGAVVYNVGGSTFLNVTVYHYPEDASHYVDIIRVTIGANTTDLTIGAQTLKPDNTLTVTYNLGPVAGTPAATVQAHCIVNGWSSVNWTGEVPEFSLPVLLLTLILGTSIAVFISRKVKSDVHK